MQEEYILIGNERALRRNLPCDGVSQLHDTARETDAQGKLPDAKMFWMFTDAWSAMARLFIRPNRHRLSNKTGSTTMQCRWRERLQFRSNLIQIPVNLLEKPVEEKTFFFQGSRSGNIGVTIRSALENSGKQDAWSLIIHLIGLYTAEQTRPGVELTHIGRSLGPHIKMLNQCGNKETGTLRESQTSHLLQQKNQTVQDNQPVKCRWSWLGQWRWIQ